MPQDIGSFATLRDVGDLLLAKYDDKWARYQPIYTAYFSVYPGDRYTETISGIYGPPEMTTMSFGQGTMFSNVGEIYKTEISAQKWGRGVSFTEEAIKFDKSGMLRRAADKLAVAARHTYETRAARVLNLCITLDHAQSGEDLVHDSQEIRGTGGTFDNRIDGDLSVANLDSAMVQFRKFVDDQNLKLNIMPKYLIVTPDDERVARQLIISEKEPYTADNQANVYRNKVEVVVNPWLTDADNWFLVAGADDNGLFGVEWLPMRRKAWVDEDADVLKFKVNAIMDFAFASWRGLIGGIGA